MVHMQKWLRILAKTLNVALLASLILAMTCPPGLAADGQQEDVYVRFEEVSSLRSQGQYDKAVEILQNIIREYSRSDEILRHAYNNLVFTLLKKADQSGAERDKSAARENAREALYRFPDLTADTAYISPQVNYLYDELRKQLFGALSVATKPESCRVFLRPDSAETFLSTDFAGFSPLHIKYVRAGAYILNVSKSGYQDQSMAISIDPGGVTNTPMSLSRERNKKWWLLRAGPAAVLTGVLLAVKLSGGEGGAAPSPLPGPPQPPGD